MNKKELLTQRGLFSDERRFEIKDGRYLFVTINKLKKNTTYQLDLVALEPKSKFRINIAWPWLLAAAVVILTSYTALEILPQYIDINLKDYAFPIRLGSASLAVISLILFVVTSCRERVFVASNTNLPLVRLLIGKPNRKAYRNFLSHLENRILVLSKHLQLNNQQQLAGELRMIRRLSKIGVVSEKKYNRFKSRLMKLAS